MSEAGKTQWYIGAPNGVILCINHYDDGLISGELYHSYKEEAYHFHNFQQMTEEMERLYDWLKFPHPGTNSRSFGEEKKPWYGEHERKKVMSDEKLLRKHGDIGTFIVRVQHRQNSSWQGRITWMEEDKTINFRSVWEMIKLIESAVDTVEGPEESEKEASWFEEEKDK